MLLRRMLETGHFVSPGGKLKELVRPALCAALLSFSWLTQHRCAQAFFNKYGKRYRASPLLQPELPTLQPSPVSWLRRRAVLLH
eukprot:COSAG04_NODE_1051_length_8554_cov_151.236310_10_plen_84_part_00